MLTSSSNIFDKLGNDVTDTMLDSPPYVEGGEISFFVKGGELGKTYYIDIKIILSNGMKLEEEIHLKIQGRSIFYAS